MHWTPPDEPDDEESLQDALEAVLDTAHSNEVCVERNWLCRSEIGPDWDVEVVPLEPEGDDGR